jgi:hypothetical protein
MFGLVMMSAKANLGSVFIVLFVFFFIICQKKLIFILWFVINRGLLQVEDENQSESC